MLIYLHGFNSSPASHKARALARAMAERGLESRFACPALPPSPGRAVAEVERFLAPLDRQAVTLVGSSLGGYYATWLAEKHGLKAVLINPAVHPDRDLRRYLGTQQNLYTGEKYELTEAHLAQLAGICCPVIATSRYLLIVETGDEVLDHREAVQRYAGAKQVVVQGGDHTLQSFDRHIPAILEFAGFALAAPAS